ncbi:hypothetical protein ACF0H5_004162 [Mactra antiquata]
MADVIKDAAYYLNLLLLTPVILCGLVGNCLSMLTWSRGCHRDTSTAVILTALAVADTVVLLLPALEFWLATVMGMWIRLENIVTCKLFGFSSYFGPSLSSWIIVLVTAERFVSIWFPVKVRFVCTRLKVKIIILFMCIIIAGIYSPFLVFMKLFDTTDYTMMETNGTNQTFRKCDTLENGTFHQIYFPIWMWMDLCILFMIPFVIIVLGNSLVLYKILKSRQILIREGRYLSYRTRIANSFTIRAIAISITFLVCLLPVTTHEVYLIHTGDRLPMVAYSLIHILLYANSAFNFILYCAIGSGFRKDLKKVISNLFGRKKVRLDHSEPTFNANNAMAAKKKNLIPESGLLA